MKPKSTLRFFLALSGSCLLAISSAHADTVNWDGDTSSDWANADNWDTAPLTTDIANFKPPGAPGGKSFVRLLVTPRP